MILHDLGYLKIEKKESPVAHLVTTWVGYAPEDDFLQGIDKILSVMEEHNLKLVMNDVREQKVISPNAQKGAAEKVKAYVGQHGLFKQAIIQSNDIFIQVGTKNFDEELASKDPINQFFNNEAEALSWLKSQQAVLKAS